MTDRGNRPTLETTILVESYNNVEGSPLDRLFLTLHAAVATADAHGSTEVVLADSSDDPELVARLEREAPSVRRVAVGGDSYDEAKMAAAAQAAGRYIVFLDGDCLPVDDGWLEAHLRTLRAGHQASAGFTHYEGGFFQRLLSVMDFGFLLPATARDLDCYASNNAAFARELLGACPIPDRGMRCSCYAHARLMIDRGTPIRLSPDAAVTHEIKPFWKERLRRGYDHVSAVWADPGLPERRLLALGPLAAPLFYGREALLDLRRLARGWRDVGFSAAGAVAAAFLLPILRLSDLIGITRALATLPSRRPSASDAPAVERQARQLA